MEEKIRKHFNELFTDAPKTRKAIEMKEEMTQNSIDKYHDLLGEGYSETDAFENVIGSIGDVTELFGDLEEKNIFSLSEKDRRKKALLTSVSVGMYIFAGCVFFFAQMLDEIYRTAWDFSILGLVLTALVCIPPTCMLVYAANMYPDYRKKEEENMVERYKESRHTSNRDKAIKGSVSTIIWTIVIIMYFLISFTSSAWHVSWVIFLIGACVQAVFELLYSLKRSE